MIVFDRWIEALIEGLTLSLRDARINPRQWFLLENMNHGAHNGSQTISHISLSWEFPWSERNGEREDKDAPLMSFIPFFARIPGDIEEVNLMKAKLDNWEMMPATDPHVPASLLKLW